MQHKPDQMRAVPRTDEPMLSVSPFEVLCPVRSMKGSPRRQQDPCAPVAIRDPRVRLLRGMLAGRPARVAAPLLFARHLV